ncbi:MAG TPA: metallophosphoesterase [Anaeromyxobacteraceae bacterium]|nr:metallophosphoesterase [Anaeromyxobacteraceae bacterium]
MTQHRFGRRIFLGGTLAAGAAAAFPEAAAAEAPAPRAEPQEFHVAGLDPAHDGLRVAQLSDLHVGHRTPSETVRTAIAEANAFRPDLVVLTGDFLSSRRSEVDAMREQLGGLAAPTVAVLGNHDHWVDARGAAEALRGHGYEVLENEWTTLRLRGAPLAIVGVGDHLTHHEDVEASFRGLAPGAAPLVLAHGPRTADALRALARPLLCLSGHTHGGQVNLPILTRLLVGGVAREPYLRGRFLVGPVQLYVNRGVGNSALAVRVNCPPEVTLATLRAAPA